MVSNLLTRNEFQQFMQFLHSVDNENIDLSDRFDKVSPLFDVMNTKCLENCIPTPDVSIDESMVPYFGRHGAKQCIHGKPMQKAKSQMIQQNRMEKVDINQPHIISVYNKGMGRVDCMDQNISAYMINHRNKKWWWPWFRFCIDMAINKAYQTH